MSRVLSRVGLLPQRADSDFQKLGAVPSKLGRGARSKGRLPRSPDPRQNRPGPKKCELQLRDQKSKCYGPRNDENMIRLHKSTSLTIRDPANGLRSTKNGRPARRIWSRDAILVNFHGFAARPKCKKNGARNDKKVTRSHKSTSRTISDPANGLRFTTKTAAVF